MKKLILFILLISSPYLYGARPPKPPPCGMGNQPPCPPPPNIPIDGGISILLAMGVGYGIKKTINLNKDENKNN